MANAPGVRAISHHYPFDRDAAAASSWRMYVAQHVGTVFKGLAITSGISSANVFSFIFPVNMIGIVNILTVAKDLTGTPPFHFFTQKHSVIYTKAGNIFTNDFFRQEAKPSFGVIIPFPEYTAYDSTNAGGLQLSSDFAITGDQIFAKVTSNIDRDYLWAVWARLNYLQRPI